MGFIYFLLKYILSYLSVMVPVALLVYQSLLKFKTSEEIPYGKWAIIIPLIYLFDWISWIFNQSFLIFFLDLLIKLAVPLIPDLYNEKIEHKISDLHLEIWLDQLRCWLIGGFHQNYWKVTEYILSKMETDESRQFKEALLINLKGETQNTDTFAFKPVKHFVNAAVNCDKMTEQIAQNISSTAKILEEYSRKIVQEKTFHNETFGQIKPTKEVSEKNEIKNQAIKKEELPKFTYKKKDLESKIVKQLPTLSLNMRASQQELDLSDDEEIVQPPQVISPINKKQQHQSHVVFKAGPKKSPQVGIKHQVKLTGQKLEEQASDFKRAYTFTEHTSSQIVYHPQSFKKAYRQDGEAFREDLIEKLELSSSEYSGMFDEEDDEDLRSLECKVEVILEIGSGPSARLQIYNLELYSNGDLRIVSSYGREFEYHRLKGMRVMPNNYYELSFEEGKIASRKCKFRGSYQPFMKYLVQN